MAVIPLPLHGVHRVELVRVGAGDTVDVPLDLGMRTHLDTRLRLAGVDAPGLSTAARRDGRWHPGRPDLEVHLIDSGLAQPYEDTTRAKCRARFEHGRERLRRCVRQARPGGLPGAKPQPERVESQSQRTPMEALHEHRTDERRQDARRERLL
jgi:endonuclease YncB( thermonuclease family)